MTRFAILSVVFFGFASAAAAQVNPGEAFEGLTLWFTKPPVGRVDGREAYILGFTESEVRVADRRRRMQNVPTAGLREVWVTKRVSYLPQQETLAEFVKKLRRVRGHIYELGTETSDNTFAAAFKPGGTGDPDPEPPPQSDDPDPRDDPPVAETVVVVPAPANPGPDPAPPAAKDRRPDRVIQAEQPPPPAAKPLIPGLPNWVLAVLAGLAMVFAIKAIR